MKNENSIIENKFSLAFQNHKKNNFKDAEKLFTIPKISKILDNFNLEFLGFTNSHIKKKFSETFPDDKRKTSLNNWNKFEIENPDAFIGMYQFWVRKIKKI